MKSQVEFLIKINRVIFWVQVLEPLKSIKSKWNDLQRSISIITCILSLWQQVILTNEDLDSNLKALILSFLATFDTTFDLGRQKLVLNAI